MSRTLSLFSLALVLIPASPASRAEEPAKDIVRRALEAAGLKETHESIALSYRHKLTLFGSGGVALWPDDLLVEAMGDTAGTAGRLSLTRKISGELLATIVNRGGNSWVRKDGRVGDLNGREAALWQGMQHTERVLWLLPLLQDRRFTLTALEEEQTGRRVLSGVRVAYPGQKDVRLYFDRQTGLLHRAHYSWEENGQTAALTQEFHDYRVRDGSEADVALLRKAGISTKGAALLEFLRDQTPDPARHREAARLVRQLGDESFAVRERAQKALHTTGRTALPLLRQAVGGNDPERARRARAVIEEVGATLGDEQVLAAVRTVARQRPKGATEVLLASLCASRDEDEKRELLAALAVLAYDRGEPDATLLRALKGPGPARSFAAAALGRDDGAYLRQAGRRLYLPSLKLAHRLTVHREGNEKVFEMQLEDVQAFNALEEKFFARPAAASE
jgi:hypothetical protein